MKIESKRAKIASLSSDFFFFWGGGGGGVGGGLGRGKSERGAPCGKIWNFNFLTLSKTSF